MVTLRLVGQIGEEGFGPIGGFSLAPLIGRHRSIARGVAWQTTCGWADRWWTSAPTVIVSFFVVLVSTAPYDA